MNESAPFAVFITVALVAVAGCDSNSSEATSTATQNNYATIAQPTPSEEQADAMRGIFHARSPCPTEIKVAKPYAVVSNLWGHWVIRGTLEALNHKDASVPDESTDPQLAFEIDNTPYSIDGVRYWLRSQTVGNLRGTAKPSPAGHNLPSGYRSWVTQQIYNGVISPTGYYYISADKLIALQCSPRHAHIANPSCDADVEDKTGRFLFSIRFPINSTRRINEFAAAGMRIFEPVLKKCPTRNGRGTAKA